MAAVEKQDIYTCSVCINANAIHIDERTPLISSNSGSSSSGNNNISSQYGDNHNHRPNEFSWVLVILLFLFFFTGIAIATYLLLNEGVNFQPEIYKLIGRDEWNASMTNGTLFKISVPSEGVLVTDTQTEHCDNLPACSGLMKYMQYDAQSFAHLPDLVYNFLIDDVGNIYEGLGWYNTLNDDDKDHLLVALIGNYTTKTTTNDQLVSLNILLKFAVDRNVLIPCYSIKVPENKTIELPLVEMAATLQIDSYRECI